MVIDFARALLALLVLQLFLGAPARAQKVSDEFTRTYHAYNDAYASGDYGRAADLAAQAVDMAKKELGPQHEKTAILEINLGHVLMLSGKVDAAEQSFNTARTTLEKLRGPDDPDLVTVHDDMARIYASRKDLDKAVDELDKAIDITVKKYGDKDPQVADLDIERGAANFARKHFDAATADYNQALSIRQQHFGADDPRTADVQSMIGDLATLQNQDKIAERDYLSALTIYQKSLVTDDPRIVAVHTKLANLYIKMHDDRFAEHADKAIALSRNVNGAALPLFVIKPRYPVLKNGNPAEGWVLLDFTVTTAGRVADAKILESSPPGLFDAGTLDAARQWRFKPYVKDGSRLAQPHTRARVIFSGGKIEVQLGEMNSDDKS